MTSGRFLTLVAVAATALCGAYTIVMALLWSSESETFAAGSYWVVPLCATAVLVLVAWAVFLLEEEEDG